MAEQTMDRPAATPEGGAHAHGDHPTPRLYVQIAVVLFVLTAMEFSTYFIEFGAMTTPLLVILMAIKFVMVAGFFMHLKYDTRLFTRLMAVGLFGALGLYVITLLSMAEITRRFLGPTWTSSSAAWRSRRGSPWTSPCCASGWSPATSGWCAATAS